MDTPSARPVLRDLPLAARLVVAAFLISVGVGYFSALVQLHFQHAAPGSHLPHPDDAVRAYYGMTGISQLERLLVTDEGKPFNGSGTMRPAFTTRSARWPGRIKDLSRAKKISLRGAEATLRAERDGERLALLAWIKSGAGRKAFDENNFVLPEDLAKRPITAEMLDERSGEPRSLKIATLLDLRCARCHSELKGGEASQFPLDTWDQIQAYCQVETTGGGMSLRKLAQSTHVHLLGFSMLYGLTGLIFAFSSYPGFVRSVIGPWPLVAQLVDIACWWLARLDPLYAKAIVVTGGVVGVGLFLQIVLSLFNLFGKTGKTVLFIVLIATGLWGFLFYQRIVNPYLLQEALTDTVPE